MTASTHRVRPTGVRALLAGGAALAACLSYAPPSGAAVPLYDGVWSVLIVTEKGDCDRGYRYPIRITNGVLANGGETAFTITGRVAPTGAIIVTVSHGDKSASGAGRLAGNGGGGHWSGGSCSGSWSAERRGS
jgi:hypothetical protein